jgi:dihydrofolate reductase
MRASVFVGASLDGFIARLDDTLDFLKSEGGEEVGPHGFEEFFATVDALVMGRRTYDVVLAFDSWPYGEKPVFVLSHRPLAAAPSGARVERLEGDPAAVIAELGRRGFGHLYVDGGAVIQQFLRAGLVQRLVVTRVPVLIGSGIPVFGPVDRDVPLRLVASRALPGGAVQSEYEVLPAAG